MPVILIVDDQSTNRSVYTRLAKLTTSDVEVEAFGDPRDALEWLEHNTVDLVITDFKMPIMNGAEFTRRLREIPRAAKVPVAVVTAHDGHSLRLRAMEAGATDFLQSPVDHYEFIARARTLLILSEKTGLVESRGGAEAGDPAIIASAVPAMLSAVDRQGRCAFVNPMQAAETGRPERELIGQGPEAIFGLDRGARSGKGDLIVLKTGVPSPPYEEEVLGRDGRRRRLLTTKVPLRDGTGAVCGVLTTSFEIASVAADIGAASMRHAV